MMMLVEEWSAITQKKLPQKLKDPKSFRIPCNIGVFSFDKALFDLGACINLMPISVFRKLGIREIKVSNITLQLAYRSLIYPYKVVDDDLVKVDMILFPVDFMLLDMNEHPTIPLILRQPFLATSKMRIVVQEALLKLGMEKEKVTFNISSLLHKLRRNCVTRIRCWKLC